MIIPLLIGGAIAIMILSYLVVPVLVVSAVGLIAYAFIQVLEEDKKRRDS